VADSLSVDPGGFALPVRHARAGGIAVLPPHGLAWDGRLGDRDVVVPAGRWRLIIPDIQARDPSDRLAAERGRFAANHRASGRLERAGGAGRDSLLVVGDRRRQAA
jgi:hypothetical protein